MSAVKLARAISSGVTGEYCMPQPEKSVGAPKNTPIERTVNVVM